MENKTFEELMVELDSIVKNLSRNDISLEEAVNAFTKGIEVSKACYDILNKNEALVVKKMTDAGLVDFKVES